MPTDLITRLSRIEGQVQALKRSLAPGVKEADCVQTLYQVKAATNALKRFGEAFAQDYAKQCLEKNMGRANLARQVDAIISSAFTLA